MSSVEDAVSSEVVGEFVPWSLSDLQRDRPDVLSVLLTSFLLDNRDEHRGQMEENHRKDAQQAKQGLDLFSAFGSSGEEEKEPARVKVRRESVRFAVDDYASSVNDAGEVIAGHGALENVPQDFDFTLIVPRSQKAKEVQRSRVKSKAEVFTPTWVCNAQNNLVDDHVVYSGAFNVADESGENWTPSDSRVFAEKREAIDYIRSRRLEISCGEAPYLVSRYDTVTGEDLPVRDEAGRFWRVGLLDRKLRVVSEVADTVDEWNQLAFDAFCATYGYEWQGDNLLLARLNLLNTYREYHVDVWGVEPAEEDVARVVAVVAMNVWQMDGLRAVVPLTAGEDRGVESRKVRPDKKSGLYDGVVPVVSFDHGRAPQVVAALAAAALAESAAGENLLSTNVDDVDALTGAAEWTPFEDSMREWLRKRAS